jgi:hypothetical protein
MWFALAESHRGGSPSKLNLVGTIWPQGDAFPVHTMPFSGLAKQS